MTCRAWMKFISTFARCSLHSQYRWLQVWLEGLDPFLHDCSSKEQGTGISWIGVADPGDAGEHAEREGGISQKNKHQEEGGYDAPRISQRGVSSTSQGMPTLTATNPPVTITARMTSRARWIDPVWGERDSLSGRGSLVLMVWFPGHPLRHRGEGRSDPSPGLRPPSPV